MKPFPHTTDPAAIDVRRSYTVAEAAALIKLSASRARHYAVTGELRTERNPKNGMRMVRGTSLRLFYVTKAGAFWNM